MSLSDRRRQYPRADLIEHNRPHIVLAEVFRKAQEKQAEPLNIELYPLDRAGLMGLMADVLRIVVDLDKKAGR